VQQRGSGSDRTARSGAARCANEAEDSLGHGSPEMVVLLCAEERQKALLIAPNIAKLPEQLTTRLGG
jgi:hypothetical protein